MNEEINLSYPLIVHMPAGGQYCCWNADETLLAASSDSFHSVIVWATPSGDCPTFRQLMRVEDTLTEALALAFHPSDPGLLCFSERRDRLYLIGWPRSLKFMILNLLGCIDRWVHDHDLPHQTSSILSQTTYSTLERGM
jgi:hypothetical protein